MPDDHLVREIAAVLDLSWVHAELAPYYSRLGRPSIDPALTIRMLIVGYVFAIRSERALCREVQVNLAYRWFCGLSIEDKIPDHSTFSRARHERFRESDIFRRVFERVVEACMGAGLVGGEGLAVDASLIVADANKQRSVPGSEWNKECDPQAASRAVKEYLRTLDDAAFGRASEVSPKFVSPSDPAAQWTGAMRGPAFFAYADNYLVDVKFGVIVDVEASRAIRQAEVGAAKRMLERTQKRLWHHCQEPCSGYGLWVGGDAQLACQREEDCAAHSGHRQIQARRRLVEPRRLQVRQGSQCLCVPPGQVPAHDRHDPQWGDDPLSRKDLRLWALPDESQMLPKGPGAQNPAQHLRGRPRRRPCARGHRGVRAIASRSQAGRNAVRSLEAHPQARPSSAPWPARRTR